MKKYIKPDLCYESFELSQSVASCSGIVFNSDGSVRSYDTSDPANQAMTSTWGLFGNSCSLVLTKDAFYNYYAGSGSGFAFSS